MNKTQINSHSIPIFTSTVNLKAVTYREHFEYIKDNIGCLWEKILIVLDWGNGFSLRLSVLNLLLSLLEYINLAKNIHCTDMAWNPILRKVGVSGCRKDSISAIVKIKTWSVTTLSLLFSSKNRNKGFLLLPCLHIHTVDYKDLWNLFSSAKGFK